MGKNDFEEILKAAVLDKIRKMGKGHPAKVMIEAEGDEVSVTAQGSHNNLMLAFIGGAVSFIVESFEDDEIDEMTEFFAEMIKRGVEEQR